jgi:hypothetical protein
MEVLSFFRNRYENSHFSNHLDRSDFNGGHYPRADAGNCRVIYSHKEMADGKRTTPFIS